MSSKVELHRKLKDVGYEVGPFASKETLANVMRLHSQVSGRVTKYDCLLHSPDRLGSGK